MIRLSEAQTKTYLRNASLPVPRGVAASSPEEAAASASVFEGAAVVKAMIPTGRRGKAGAVRTAGDAAAREAVTRELLGTQVNGFPVDAVYVEEHIAIKAEYYFAIVLDDRMPKLLLSRQGGVDIEAVSREHPEAVIQAMVDPLEGLTPWVASELWLRAGVSGSEVPMLATISCRLYDAFCRADALMLEINPLVIDSGGHVQVVGAMMGVDPNALFRHPDWAQTLDSLPANPRERAVEEANRLSNQGECQYIELDGDIGLLVGGGGAGLYQHDLILSMGGAPANHCVTPPTSSDNSKLKAVLKAILGNPSVRGLLIGFNFAQMARTDIRVSTLVELIDEMQVDADRLPIVIRLFGAGEEKSRAMVAGRKNIHYMPRGTTLKDAVKRIVELTAEARAAGEVSA